MQGRLKGRVRQPLGQAKRQRGAVRQEDEANEGSTIFFIEIFVIILKKQTRTSFP